MPRKVLFCCCCYIYMYIGTKGDLALASCEFVGEQSRKEENTKHVPSCTLQNEGVGCVCNTTS